MALLPDPASLSAASLLALVCAVTFTESALLVGFWLPGDAVLFPAGLATASPSLGVSCWTLAAAAGGCALVGYEIAYETGRRWGRPLVRRRVGKRLGPDVLDRAERLLGSWGPFLLVSARFVPWLRTMAPLIAGAAVMRRFWFTVANVVGALVWAVGLVLLGRLSAHVPGVRHVAVAIAGVAIGGSLVVAAAGVLRRRHRSL